MSLFRNVTLGIVSLLVIPLSSKAELPTWEEFIELLGKPITDAKVQQFVTKYQLGQSQKHNSGSFDNFKQMPFSLLYNKNRLNRIVVCISRNPESDKRLPVYDSPLLLGLKRQDTPKDVFQRLGKGKNRSDSNYLTYTFKKFGLVLTFDRKTSRLEEIDLDYIPPRIADFASPYNDMDAKAIQAVLDRLVKKLNSDLPSGWQAEILKDDIDSSVLSVAVRYKKPVAMETVLLPNPSNADRVQRVTETFYFSFMLLKKDDAQEWITHVYEGCPFSFFDLRRFRTIMDDDVARQCDDVLNIAERIITKQVNNTR